MPTATTQPTTDRPPRVFFSYTHDSPEHVRRVRELADRLRRDGVDVRLDQYEASPTEGWIAWTQRQLFEADAVLVICTQTYNRRNQGFAAIARGQGASWEEALLGDALFRTERSSKLIPVIFEPADRDFIPIQLKAASWYEAYSAEGYERLLRRLKVSRETAARVVPGTTRRNSGPALVGSALSWRQLFSIERA